MIIRSKAPLRIGIAGGGSDVSPYSDLHAGAVINATINLYAHCTLVPRPNENEIGFFSQDTNKFVSVLKGHEYSWEGCSLPLHVGVFKYMSEIYFDKHDPFNLYTWVDVPWGSGLGASSALIVAMITAYDEWLEIGLGKYEIAELAYRIEREYLGMKGGKQDQYAATFGGINHMVFSKGTVVVDPLRLKREIINELEETMLLFYTGKGRDSSDVIEQQIANIENETPALQNTHELVYLVSPIQKALYRGNINELAYLIDRSWEIKKKLAHNVSNEHIDRLMYVFKNRGAKAIKISGAGNGGFMFMIIDPLDKRKITSCYTNEKDDWYDFSFTDRGVESWKL